MKLTIEDIKKMNIGDKFVAKSFNPNFYVSGICDGVVFEIVNKMELYNPKTFEKIIGIIVKYNQMKCKSLVNENAETLLVSNGIQCEEPIERKLEDTDPVGYWYETID